MRTSTRGAVGTLAVVSLLLFAGSRWTDMNDQREVERDRNAGPERTYDDRRFHTIRLHVRYRPARVVYVTWGVGEEGGESGRGPGDRPEWEEIRYRVPEGTLVSLFVDNGSEGGYVNCEGWEDARLRYHHVDENSPANREVCTGTFVVGGH